MPVDHAQLDRDYVWHPFTQQQGWSEEAPLVIERGEGSYLFDTEGRRYLDGTAALWCNVHGHRHPRLDAAVREQLDRVAHTTMLGLSHPPAIELARRLAELSPPGRGRASAYALCRPPRRLSRRHRRFGLTRGDRPVSLALPAAPVRGPTRRAGR